MKVNKLTNNSLLKRIIKLEDYEMDISECRLLPGFVLKINSVVP